MTTYTVMVESKREGIVQHTVKAANQIAVSNRMRKVYPNADKAKILSVRATK